MVTRRRFIEIGSLGTAGLYLASRYRFIARLQANAFNLLPPAGIPKYVTPLVVPPAMPRTTKLVTRGGKNIDYYEIAVRQFAQHILPRRMGLQPTTVWGYGSLNAPGTVTEGGSFNFPSFTIEAKWRAPVRVKWVNDLTDASGRYLPHLLPVDQTLHWANPPGGVAGRDMRPTFTSTPGPYTGPVPIVTHLHGSADVGDESDGYAEAWFLPAATNIPSDYATVGTWYETFKRLFNERRGVGHESDTWAPGTATFQYPNDQRASSLWYHDHTLGLTRANVYAGPAGFYLLRGGPDDEVIDTRNGRPATLPGPAPALGDRAGTKYYEIPLAIQDRSFQPDGSLFYPDSRAFFDEYAGPYLPDTDVSPIWNPEFFGNTMLVNGNTWPYLEVEQRRYRFRVLNGCNSRFLILKFDANLPVWQIGTEGGFLPAPLDVGERSDGRLLLAPAERADLIVDFSGMRSGSEITLLNLGPDEPFGGGEPDTDFASADGSSTGQVMQFRVVTSRGRDQSTPPEYLQLPRITPLTGGSPRRLALLEEMSMDGFDGPVAAVLGTMTDGEPKAEMWHDPITENPAVGSTEVWEFYNFTADAHPIHVHEVMFQVVDRQGLVLDPDSDEPVVPAQLTGSPRPPEPSEAGFKDTVIAYPGEVTRIRAHFGSAGLYVWHCHIVEHEDNEMMRPYAVGPIPEPDSEMP